MERGAGDRDVLTQDYLPVSGLIVMFSFRGVAFLLFFRALALDIDILTSRARKSTLLDIASVDIAATTCQLPSFMVSPLRPQMVPMVQMERMELFRIERLTADFTS